MCATSPFHPATEIQMKVTALICMAMFFLLGKKLVSVGRYHISSYFGSMGLSLTDPFMSQANKTDLLMSRPVFICSVVAIAVRAERI